MGAEDAQAVEVEEVARLPQHVAAHKDNVVQEDISLHQGVDRPGPLNKVSHPEVQVKWEVESGEKSIGYKTFKHPFLFPGVVIDVRY